jgi:cell division protein FtsW
VRKKAFFSGMFYSFLWVVLALLAVGTVMVLSSSSTTAFARTGSSFYLLWRQLLALGIGVVVFTVMIFFNYQWLKTISPFLALISLAALVAVLIPGVGVSSGGACRWISVFGYRFQPSELSKFALVIYLAALVSSPRSYRRDWRKQIVPILIIVSSVILIARQPDFGTAVIVLSTIFVVMFLGRVSFKLLLSLIATSGLLGVLSLFKEPYQLQRIKAFVKAFINPLANTKGSGYHLAQSLYALGSGHLTGIGIGLSRQKFGYLPAAYTDFIFAVIGEEGGLIATVGVVCLFVALAVLGVKISRKAPDHFGRVLTGGIIFLVIEQAFLNISGVTGLLPITGVPLPLISFGGSSLVFTLASLGVVLNICWRSSRKRKLGGKLASDDLRRRNRRPRLSRAGASSRT